MQGAPPVRVMVAPTRRSCRVSTSWTIPVEFADRTLSGTTASPSPATAQLATHVVNVALRPVTTTPPPAPPVPVPVTRAAAGGPVGAATATVTSAHPLATPSPTPTPTRAAPAPAPRDSAVGLATWYGARVGTCASPVLAFGTVVTVTDLATGASVRCTVDDREAHNPGRVIDLAPATFAQLASLRAGVIEVRLSW